MYRLSNALAPRRLNIWHVQPRTGVDQRRAFGRRSLEMPPFIYHVLRAPGGAVKSLEAIKRGPDI